MNNAALKVHLVVIDPQQDFMDGWQDATLPVTGATEDMRRLASMIDRVGPRLAGIHVTLDSHQEIDVGHPHFWRNRDGKNPPPFTMISADDIKNDIWVPRKQGLKQRMIAYAETLEQNGNYPLMVWPEHCIVGEPGWLVQEDLRAALKRWKIQQFRTVDNVTKGTNPLTEHYGALEAEVPDPNDPSTQLNTRFIDMLAQADIVVVAGEALSHCVKSTVDQIAGNIGEEHIRKFHILTDATSPVGAVPNGPDFPEISRQWLKDMESRGMHLTTTDAFLA
jgi:nicotinamidase/pyrazinamidase